MPSSSRRRGVATATAQHGRATKVVGRRARAITPQRVEQAPAAPARWWPAVAGTWRGSSSASPGRDRRQHELLGASGWPPFERLADSLTPPMQLARLTSAAGRSVRSMKPAEISPPARACCRRAAVGVVTWARMRAGSSTSGTAASTSVRSTLTTAATTSLTVPWPRPWRRRPPARASRTAGRRRWPTWNVQRRLGGEIDRHGLVAVARVVVGATKRRLPSTATRARQAAHGAVDRAAVQPRSRQAVGHHDAEPVSRTSESGRRASSWRRRRPCRRRRGGS